MEEEREREREGIVVDPDPNGSVSFGRIRIWIRYFTKQILKNSEKNLIFFKFKVVSGSR